MRTQMNIKITFMEETFPTNFTHEWQFTGMPKIKVKKIRPLVLDTQRSPTFLSVRSNFLFG